MYDWLGVMMAVFAVSIVVTVYAIWHVGRLSLGVQSP
jgi:hypothetical protein